MNFTLNLPPQVVAVDPQPIVDQTTLTVKTVSGNGGLTNGDVLTLNAVAVPSTGVTPVTEPTALQFSTTGVNGTLIPGTNNICVSFSSTMTPAQVAQNLSQAIEAAGTDLIASASFNVVTIESSALGVDRTKMASPNAITVGVLPQAQLRNTVNVYFTDNDPLNPASATDTNFYQLINTKGSADDTKDAVYTPMSAYYDPNLNRVRLPSTLPPGIWRASARAHSASAWEMPTRSNSTTSTNPATDANDSTIGTTDLGPSDNVSSLADMFEFRSRQPTPTTDFGTGHGPNSEGGQAVVHEGDIDNLGLDPVRYPGGPDQPGEQNIPTNAITDGEEGSPTTTCSV